MHGLLERQLRRLGLGRDTPPPTLDQWNELLDRVAASYVDADQDRYTLERSLSLSSREMQQLYQDLQRSAASALAAERDKLQANVAVLHATLDASTDGVLVVGPDGKVLNFNRRFAEIWQVPDELAAATDHGPLVDHVDAMLAEPGDALGQRDDQAASRRDEVRLADGRVLERYSAPVLLPTGAALGQVWFFRDVTDARNADAEVRRVNRFLDSVVENLPDMIFVKDAATLRLVRINRAGEQLIGVGRDQLIGKSDHELFPAAEADAYVAADRATLRGAAVVEIAEEPLDTATLGRRVLHTKKIPIRDEAGQAVYLLGISRDITDARRTEQELREAKELAERASQIKSGFLSNMSHEMRTPLNAILGFARQLDTERPGPLTDRQREYVGYVLRAGQHMRNLVEDLLDLRRIEEDRAALAVTRVEIGPLVDEAIGMVRAMADESAQRIAIDLEPTLPEAQADRRALVQILVNLLSNAVKFTPAGGEITVRVRADVDRLRVAVVDTGIGIHPDDQPRLFTYFEQLGAKHAHHMKGSGIGLALTRAMVEKLGGTIALASAPGLGSTFEFSVPRWSEAA